MKAIPWLSHFGSKSKSPTNKKKKQDGSSSSYATKVMPSQVPNGYLNDSEAMSAT